MLYNVVYEIITIEDEKLETRFGTLPKSFETKNLAVDNALELYFDLKKKLEISDTPESDYFESETGEASVFDKQGSNSKIINIQINLTEIEQGISSEQIDMQIE